MIRDGDSNMQTDKKFFSFNNKRDFGKCGLINMVSTETGCHLENLDTSRKGTLFIKPLDAYEKGMIWDRMTIEAHLPKGTKITGYFFATEEESLYEDMRRLDLDVTDKIDRLREEKMVEIPYPQDALLHNLKGRYLLGWLSVYAPEGPPSIKRIRFHYPKASLLDYLPEYYQVSDEGDFLHRYLSIFQSILSDMEAKIDLSPSHLIAKHGDHHDIWWLAESLGLESPEIWTDTQLRKRVEKAVELSGIRGTRRAVEEVSSFITGKSCYVIEQHDLDRGHADAYLNQLFDKLYGAHPNDFTVLVPDDALASERKYNQMKKALSGVKPAYTSARLVSLQPYLRLDQHAYLGINSRVNQPGQLVLDNSSALPYNTVLSDRAERKMHNEE